MGGGRVRGFGRRESKGGRQKDGKEDRWKESKGEETREGERGGEDPARRG